MVRTDAMGNLKGGRRPRGGVNSEPRSDALGRQILLVTGAAAVLVAGTVGFFVGANGADVMSTIRVFGLVALPTTPAAVATYGALLATAVLAGLFGAVEFASRREGSG